MCSDAKRLARQQDLTILLKTCDESVNGVCTTVFIQAQQQQQQLTMGVITNCRLPEGMTFGPVPPSVTLTDPIVLIGHRTCDTPPDIHTVKVGTHAAQVYTM